MNKRATSKMAIFAEGQTEVEFDSRLIAEIAGLRPITIDLRRARRKETLGCGVTRLRIDHTDGKGDLTTHYFLLLDCAGEDSAKSRLLREYKWLINAGYSEIVLHRDVAPRYTFARRAELEEELPKCMPTKPVAVTYILSVMEIEAWFLGEHTHFQKIDPGLAVGKIAKSLGFNPEKDELQTRQTPAQDLNDCYALAGKAYDKFSSQTVDAIDYVVIYAETAPRFPYLERLRDKIETFLNS
jgi:hypothetical protein